MLDEAKDRLITDTLNEMLKCDSIACITRHLLKLTAEGVRKQDLVAILGELQRRGEEFLATIHKLKEFLLDAMPEGSTDEKE